MHRGGRPRTRPLNVGLVVDGLALRDVGPAVGELVGHGAHVVDGGQGGELQGVRSWVGRRQRGAVKRHVERRFEATW